MSKLRQRLAAGQFVISTDMEPPKGTDLSHLQSTARFLVGKVHAANVTDNQRAVMRLSSLGGAAVLLREGVEPILQVTCRDRNRMAIQSDLLTAWVLGIKNVLTMTGDPVDVGDHRQAKPVFDLSSGELITLISRLTAAEYAGLEPWERDLAVQQLAVSVAYHLQIPDDAWLPCHDVLQARIRRVLERDERISYTLSLATVKRLE